MEKEKWLSIVDWELERRVLLFVADEIPYGLYELPDEFVKYDLDSSSRLELAISLLSELLNEELIVIEAYESTLDTYPQRTLSLWESNKIINDDDSWSRIKGSANYSIAITKKGNQSLSNLSEEEQKSLKWRLFGKYMKEG